MGRSAGIIQVGPGYNHKCPDRMKAGRAAIGGEEKAVTLEADTGVMWLRDTGRHKKLGEQGTVSSLAPSEEAQPCWHHGFRPERLISDFWPPGLWENDHLLLQAIEFAVIVTTAGGNEYTHITFYTYVLGWAPKNWCFWTMVLEKTLESPLDSKEI